MAVVSLAPSRNVWLWFPVGNNFSNNFSNNYSYNFSNNYSYTFFHTFSKILRMDYYNMDKELLLLMLERRTTLLTQWRHKVDRVRSSFPEYRTMDKDHLILFLEQRTATLIKWRHSVNGLHEAMLAMEAIESKKRKRIE